MKSYNTLIGLRKPFDVEQVNKKKLIIPFNVGLMVWDSVEARLR